MSDAPVPPQNLEAEESVLSAMIQSPAAIDRVVETGVKKDDFYSLSHGRVYQAIVDLWQRNEPVDAITLYDFLEERGEATQIGGKQKIHTLAVLTPATSNAPHYATIVKEHAALRRLIRAGEEIARLGHDRPGDLDELLVRAEAALSGAVTPTIQTQFGDLGEALDEILDDIKEAIKTGQPRQGMMTGFLDLDRRLNGLHPGKLYLIAARPSMGKSALAQNIAENVADSGAVAAMLSLEMSKTEIALRSLSRASGINSSSLRTGNVRPDDYGKLAAGKEKVLTRKPYFLVEDSTAVNVQTLRAEARRIHRQNGLQLLIVDYIGLMVSGQTEDSRQQEIAAISRNLKLLARELEIPVLALSQLNRGVENRDEKRPRLSDLRDSGALEQDADVVMFVYRDDYYNPQSHDQGIAEIIVAKNRQGETGTEKLSFVGGKTEFKNLATGLSGGLREEKAA